MMTFVFFKLRFKSHCLQYFSKISSFSCNPFLVRENIAKSSAKSKKLISVLDYSGDSFFRLCMCHGISIDGMVELMFAWKKGGRYWGEVGAIHLSGQRNRLKVPGLVHVFVGGMLPLGVE